MGLPTIEENPNGFHQRYIVTKASGEPVDPDAVYLVLRLDNGGKDKEHVRACRIAAVHYACAAPPHMKQMADELMEKLRRFQNESQRA